MKKIKFIDILIIICLNHFSIAPIAAKILPDFFIGEIAAESGCDIVTKPAALAPKNNNYLTWTLLSVAGEDYNSFNFYHININGDKGYVVGSNGKIKRVIIISANPPYVPVTFGLVDIPTAASVNNITAGTSLTAAYFTTADKGWVAGSSSGTIYYTANATATYPDWQAISTTAAGIKNLCFDNTSGNGIVLATNGTLYKIVGSTATAIAAGEVYAGIDDNTLNIYGFNKTTRTVKFIAKSSIASGTSNLPNTFGTGAVMPAANEPNVVTINAKNTGIIYTAGLNGDMFVLTASTSWNDRSAGIAPLAIRDIQAAGTNNIYAVGAEGSLLQTTNGTAWKTLATGTAVNFNAIKFNSTAVTNPAVGLIAGDAGMLCKHSISASIATLSPVVLTTTGNLYDIALNTANKAYVSGASGTVISIPNILAAAPVPYTIAGLRPTEDFRGICFKTGSNSAYAVGDHAAVYNYNNTSGAKIKSVFTPELRDVNFINAQNGYTVGEKGIIRHTQDGGLTWDVVLPVNSTGGNSIPTLNGVWTSAANKAVIIGNSGYLANIGGNAGNTVTYNSTVVTSNDLFDVAIKPNGKGYIVGANGAVYKTNTGGTTWLVLAGTSAPTTTLGALHIFSDGNFITVGDQKKIYYFNGIAWITHSPPTAVAGTTVFTDVFFHDDRSGYVVGSGGVVLKCALTANISTLGNTTNSWQIRPLTGVNGVPSPLLVNMVTIDFASRYSGFLGGYFNDNRLSANYARLVNDESNIFSTRFWFDCLGRMVISQNTKQYNKTPRAYSYTNYDALGRISEVGEKSENTSAGQPVFASIFGEYVNGQYNPNLINDAKLNLWISAGGRKEVTHTYYDNTAITGLPITQDNLRKRVASVTYEDVDDSNPQTFQSATHFGYDLHGSVKTLLQDNKKLYDLGVLNNSTTLQGQRYKRMDYDYDLISGKVNLVRYQDGKPDAFYHFYEYDADNRITNVYTSKYPQNGAIINSRVVEGNPLWEQDAKYFYYGHGAVSRVELGNYKVQGMDFAYTLQAWIKGVNSNTLDASRDMSLDGKSAINNPNSTIAKDAFGYTLNYHANDYNAIESLRWTNPIDRFEAYTPNSDLIASTNDLFNGNISSMVSTILKPTITPTNTLEYTPLPQGTAYKYDQLNRLLEMKAWQNIDAVNNKWSNGLAYNGMYNNTFTYDANGNILTQLRKDQSGTTINDLAYQRYKVAGKTMQNRLYMVDDAVSNTVFTDDIDDQGTIDNTSLANVEANNNYGYDEIGSLKRNNQKGIAQIKYSVYGKVKEVIRTSGSAKKNLKFDYDATGNRIAKHIYTSANVFEKSEYYLLDAQGNVMSTYEYKPVGTSMSFAQTEKNIFGSTRIGTDKTFTEMIGALPLNSTYSHTLGNRQYDGVNHLGNVLVTFTDRKLPIDADNNGIIDEFWPQVISTNDYYPFGVKMKERSFSSTNNRYQFNGKQFDTETETSDFGARNLDEDLGIWNVEDKLASKYPYASPYNYVLNNPIFNFDPDGNGVTPVDQKTKTQFETNISIVFAGELLEIGKKIKYDVIGTVKVDNNQIAIKGFYFSGSPATIAGDISKAERIIKGAKIDVKNKLIALAYLKAVTDKDILYLSGPQNESNATLNLLLSSSSSRAEANSLYNANPTEANQDALTGGDFRYDFNDTPFAEQPVDVDNSTVNQKINGVITLKESSEDNITKGIINYTVGNLGKKIFAPDKQGNNQILQSDGTSVPASTQKKKN